MPVNRGIRMRSTSRVPTSIVVTPSTLSITSGSSPLIAAVYDQTGTVMAGTSPDAWASSSPSVVTVSVTGLVTFVAVGTSNVTASLTTAGGTITSNACAVTATTGTTVWKMDFETMTASGPTTFTGSPSGNTATNPWGASIDVIPDPTSRATGKVARIAYANDPAHGFFDDNKALFANGFSLGLGQTMWFQGDFYVDNDTILALRKLIYWKTENPPDPSMVITLSQDGTATHQHINVIVNQATGVGTTDFDPAIVTAKTWIRLKVQLVMNSAVDSTDGILRIWLNNVLKFETTTVNWVSSTFPSFAFTDFAFGYQMQYVAAANTESRYWDTVSFATTEGAL